MVIGIGGISNSGKSKLAEIIKDNIKDKKVKILCQDNFVFPYYEIPLINGHVDWECAESINFVAFRDAILDAKESYDVVIAEGLLVFYSNNICKFFDKKIFVDISKGTFIERKKKDFRWGKEPDWYIQHIWRSFITYGNIPKNDKSFIIISGEKDFDINSVINSLN